MDGEVKSILEKHQWQDRLLLIFAGEQQRQVLKEQLQLFHKEQRACLERNLKIYQITSQQVVLPNGEMGEDGLASPFYRLFTQQKSAFSLLLIGKDGGVKLERKELTDPSYIFTLIDGMPMRRREMRQQQGKG